MIAALLLAALMLTPPEEQTGVVVDAVDMVEVNHFYDDHGELVFDQLIFYDWCERANRFQVRAWRLLKATAQRPQRNWNGGGFVIVWHDGDLLRRVEAQVFRETWTQHDPEMDERSILAKEKRRELTAVRSETTGETP
jgi:hypothetical protein